MKKLKKIRYYFGALRSNWKTKYRLVIRNDTTHRDRISFRLSPKNVFVLFTISVLFLVIVTFLFIAFTPLRYYVPGYTDPDEYRNFRIMALRVDSLERAMVQNQQYIDNFYNVLHDRVVEEEMAVEPVNQRIEQNRSLSEKEQQVRQEANEAIWEEAEMVLREISEHNASVGGTTMPLARRADINTLLLLPPAHGVIISEFNPMHNQMGIRIRNNRNTLINSVADGVIIYSGYDPIDGNTVIIQHSGNVISIYKHAEILLKPSGYRVQAGEPVAEMGDSGLSSLGVNLYFELWYNGIQVNPLDYIVIN